jgi:tetratricopeptide (TPR) repeat protein
LAECKPSVGLRVRALILGIVPGLAHIFVLDRPGWGTLHFVAFILGADAALAGLYLFEDDAATWAYVGGCGVAGAAWLISWLDTARLIVFRDYEKRAALRKQLTAEGVRLYAGGDLLKASGAFHRCLDLDHRDPDVLFWYGVVEAARGKTSRAIRAFRRCRHYDLDGKWDFEVGRQEEALEAAAKAGSGG